MYFRKLLMLLLMLCVVSASAQIIRPFSHRYYNPSVRGNIKYVSNSIISTAGVAAGNPGTGEPSPAGTTTNNGGAGMYLNVNPATLIVPFNSNWKYWANTQANFPAGWQNTAFVDAAWPAGNGELGYGDGDEATCIPSGGGGTLCLPTGNKWITSYFRKTINIADPTIYNVFTFNVERDDGFVLYVNGVEVGRDNMPAGAVNWATGATAAIEDAVISVNVPSTAFVAGNNVIAVEIHQATVVAGPLSSSSDVSFNLQMYGSTVFSSTTSDLTLASCSKVLWAGLYWGAGQGTNGTNVAWITGENTCKLKIPGAAAFTNITATTVDYHNNTLVPGLVHTGYKSFADITSLINTTNPNGTYSVADVIGPIGINNSYGGWTIVVAYENTAEIIRELNVFDGNAIADNGQPPIDINLTGFNTPASGPVSAELGTVAYDGDRGSLDGYSFRQGIAGAFVNLTPNTRANLNDMWNSTITYKGLNVLTRNPTFLNTLGYDADIIDLPNAANVNLGNSQTAATIRLFSPGENYMVQVVTASISTMNPYLQLIKSSTDVNGGTLLGLEQLQYQIQYTNTGNDSSLNTYIIDTIPTGTAYSPNSLMINGVAKTDAAGDDEAEYDAINRRVIFRIGAGANAVNGGRVRISDPAGTVNFTVITPDVCAVNTCVNPISNQASIYYSGATSGDNFNKRSVKTVSGCTVEEPLTDVVFAICRNQGDTILTNTCPAVTRTIPQNSFVGYTFYSAMPFTPANWLNPATIINSTRTIYAYFDGPGVCDDTVRISAIITACPDIDDDDDGIPDYVESGNPLALADHNGNGTPNWSDPAYPGFVDFNADGVNDLFDGGADHDNDGTPNFYDVNFPGRIDSNGDGVDDNFDKDKDGLINQYDRDSDNDGIPDVTESFGVDANGDGRIDNFTDTDGDGLSQNVDANGTGVVGSGAGLGARDTDGDGIANYLDLDSDNDGIPDLVEAYGTDSNNDGKIDVFTDTDSDGYADSKDGDVGNDGIAENQANALLRTGPDANNDGRADSWPFVNMDGDSKPNPYDLDSDGDGITEVREANFTDANFDSIVDGPIDANGWKTAISSLPTLTLPNSDGTGRVNMYDIDSDDDGIPDNVESLPTTNYLLPQHVDSDSDGIDNSYDNFIGFGGLGASPNDQDNDLIPDYLDLDTDSDGQIDRIEGNDFNMNNVADDNVTLTGLDTDGDGLDNRFDADNSSAEVTSAFMGNGGSLTGDPTPGSITVVQRSNYLCGSEREWRCQFGVLPVTFTSFKGSIKNQSSHLNWDIEADEPIRVFEVQRSLDGSTFQTVSTVNAIVATNSYSTEDPLQQVTNETLYYRVMAITQNGQKFISKTIVLKHAKGITKVQLYPNPARSNLRLNISLEKSEVLIIMLYDTQGRIIKSVKINATAGNNNLEVMQGLENLTPGTYLLKIQSNEQVFQQHLIIQR